VSGEMDERCDEGDDEEEDVEDEEEGVEEDVEVVEEDGSSEFSSGTKTSVYGSTSISNCSVSDVVELIRLLSISSFILSFITSFFGVFLRDFSWELDVESRCLSFEEKNEVFLLPPKNVGRQSKNTSLGVGTVTGFVIPWYSNNL